jgi:hypothetical protein
VAYREVVPTSLGGGILPFVRHFFERGLLERRFHSPYKHWVAGFWFEILVFTGVVFVLSAAAVLAAWLFG